METIITNRIGVTTKVFAETFEYEAYEQIKALTNYEPYLGSKIRIMPDAHAGKGCTVGTTMTITDKVTPNLVGVDIGCGMLTIKLRETEIDFERLDNVIKNFIPSGFNVHDKKKVDFEFSGLRCFDKVDIQRAALSLGSLGGGNHFIEVNRGKDGLYLVIHSGSRKLGGDLCKYYQDKAFASLSEMGRVKADLVERLKREGREKDIDSEMKKIHKPSANKDLAHLMGKDFEDYMNDMAVVQRFAYTNRATMAKIILENMGLSEEARFDTIHNYIDFSRKILRKGAISAEKGEIILIPLNMRDGSLICLGKGNPDWNYSAPHGAGRILSRSKAKEALSMTEFERSMEGIYTTSVGKETLDEAPQAYKSADEIIKLIEPTADILDIIKPLYNFKAH